MSFVANPVEVSAFGTPARAADVRSCAPVLHRPRRSRQLPVETPPQAYAVRRSSPSDRSSPPRPPERRFSRTSTEDIPGHEEVNLNDLLEETLKKSASDLHLTTGSRPQIRLHGHLTKLEEYPVMTPQVIQRMLYAAITQKQREKFEENLELDFSYSVPGQARFRVNIYRQRDSLGAAFRLIPFEIKKLEDLGIPPSAANFAMLPRGFVLVTGPTGSGKSTTLASIVDLANRQRRDHIMTVEDPIEFLHTAPVLPGQPA